MTDITYYFLTSATGSQAWWPRSIFSALFFSSNFAARKQFCSWSTFPTSRFWTQHLPRRKPKQL